MILLSSCLGLAVSTAAFAVEGPMVPYELETGRWLFDARGIVSRNDVVYTTPSVQPWEAMPTGGGDLSAMVRFDGDLHLHLTKSDAWGFQAPPDAKPGARFFNNVSPGHVRVAFGRSGTDAAKAFFRQRLDLYHGRVVIDLGDEGARARLVVWGHPKRNVLVVEVIDPKSILSDVRVELTEWRETMNVSSGDAMLQACEIQRRPARPHLANTGMQDYFDAAHDPLKGRGIGVAVAAGSITPVRCAAKKLTGTLTLPDKRPPTYHLIIASAVTPSGSGAAPLAVAKRELGEVSRTPLSTLQAEHQAWWRDYWGRSFLRVTSPGKTADWLTAAYHVHLYTLGCTNRGPVPAKWDGGAGLMRRDERNWGLAEWVQEIRFTYMPLYSANRLEMARGLADHYSGMIDYLAEQTETMWGIDGLWIPETVLPWGHAEDWVLADDGRGAEGHYQRWDPKAAPYGRFELYNPYVGFLFTAGLEVCHHYLTYYRYSGDEAFARQQAYPIVRGVCAFVAGLMRKGQDSRYHLDPANALETWWMVRDPSDTLDGIRAIFPAFIRFAERYDRDAGLRDRCATILAALPDAPLGHWSADSRIDANVDVYAPAAKLNKFVKRVNAENPALYRVYPFGLSGIGTPDYDRARRTFDHRICSLGNGWSMDAIWAARLGLGEQACALAAQHAKRYNRFRYGGWDSNDSRVFPDGLAAAPFLDAGGLSAFALSEMLLQSHNGVIRLAPAVARTWSGIFRLRAEGGFLVAADFRDGDVRFAEIISLLGNPCTIANPWPTGCVIRRGSSIIARRSERTVGFETEPGGRYLLESAKHPLAAYRPVAIQDTLNQSAGLPGRD